MHKMAMTPTAAMATPAIAPVSRTDEPGPELESGEVMLTRAWLLMASWFQLHCETLKLERS